METSLRTRTKVLACIALFACLFMNRTNAEEVYSFGVLNQAPAAELAQLWNPILQYVAQKTGVKLRFTTGKDVVETDEKSARGEYDFLYSNHIFDPQYSQANYLPIAQWGGSPLIGQLLVNDESPAKSIKDLAGQTIGFPSKTAFIAYNVIKYELAQNGVAVTETFGASQQGVATQLRAGQISAGSRNKLFADKLRSENPGRFRVVYETGAWPNIPVLAHPRIAKDVRDKVRAALLEMTLDAHGKSLLQELKIAGFLPATDADYKQTRALYQSKF